jgi:tetratricopeptide (TPR) repeat protein
LAVALCCALAAGPAAGAPKKVDPDEVKARSLVKEGGTAYDLGQFTKALELYTEAYKLKALAGFLFNIAQCHRQLGNFKDAAFFYGRYIDNSSPKEPNVERARELLEDMKQKQADAEVAAKREEEARRSELKRDTPTATVLVPDAPPAPPPLVVVAESEPVTKKAWFWVVIVSAVAVAAGGTVTAVVLTRPTTTGPPALPPTTLPDIR